MDADDLILFNSFEALLWFALALILFFKGRQTPLRRRHFTAAAFLLFAFGLSDLVETQTGAWWKPWWLFAWKAGCVAGVLALIVHARKTGPQKQNPS